MDLKSYLQNECMTAAAFAGRLDLTRAAVSAWLKGRNKVGVTNIRAIEQATGGKVTRHDLRPDIFGAAPARARKKAA